MQHVNGDLSTLVAAVESGVPGLVESAHAIMASTVGVVDEAIREATTKWLSSLIPAGGLHRRPYHQENRVRLDAIDASLAGWAFHCGGHPPGSVRYIQLGPDLYPAELKWAAARASEMGLAPDRMTGRGLLGITMPEGWSLRIRPGKARIDEGVRTLLADAAAVPRPAGERDFVKDPLPPRR